MGKYTLIFLILLLTTLGISEPAWADNCSSLSDCYGVIKNAAIAGGLIAIFIGLALDFTPIIGDIKGIIEAFIGKDLVTGQRLEWWERVLGAIPIVGRVGDLAKVGRAADAVGDITRGANDLGDLARGADNLGDAARATGGRSGKFMDEFTRWEKYAPEAYDTIRETNDVSDIARHTGFPESKIEQIKDHLFHKEHQLDDRIGRFDPDPDIADAWHRLQQGEHVPEDLRLLEHEYFESQYEITHGTDYRTAHEAAINAGYTWNPPTLPQP